MKKLVIVLAAIVIVTVGCEYTPDSEEQTSQVVEDQQAHYIKTQPVPFFDHSQDRDTLIQIYEAKNEARQTNSVITSFTGEILFTCPSIGYGVAADTQLTNPLQQVGGSYGYTTVEQPEPNGLFSSKNTDATYVLCVRDNGDVVPVYTESKVTTFPFGVDVDENGLVTDAGDDSTITVDVGGDE